ncbi:hypothetical protein [Alienimonas californiensis]|uniref:Uncharacterized protein n=1 Tax=Alienimonas californiensis TaxID=2527989 RepID=A0A517PD62_9PLAN|nr:hypothetical protein [Alienimonas californiensis]QDT17309.1 hypothetical protein CA12_34290 [Alienimonas californiensis]
MPSPPALAETAGPGAGGSGSRPSRPEPSLRPELGRLLSAVRTRLRTYVLLRGLALVILTAIGVFWAALGLDDAWFYVTKLELPTWLRIGFDGAALLLLFSVAAIWLVGRLVVAAAPRDLALAVERRFPDLRGRLVLAVERAANPAVARQESPFTAALADRAAADAAERVRALPTGELFDPAPLRRDLALAAVLLAGTIAFAFWQTDAVRRLSDAYVELADVYRVRTTALSVAAVLPPGDERKLLTPGEPHRHPRGADLVLLIGVADGERPGGGPWTAPEKVTVTRETAGGATGRSFALPDGPGQFRFALDEVRDGMTVWLTGGDFVTRTPYVIEAVDPPRPRRVALSAKYPAYMQRNAQTADGGRAPEVGPIRGAKATVPVGTEFDLILEANKPLAAARVTIDGEPVPLALETAAGESAVRVPLTMLPPEPIDPADGDAPADSFSPAAGTVGVRPGARVAVELEDADGIRSQSPVRLVLAGLPDDPPNVRAEPVGVSDVLTRTASVPFVGTIEDDYGIASARFLYKLTGGEPAAAAPPDGGGDGAGEDVSGTVAEASADPQWRERRFRARPRNLPERFDVGDRDPARTADRDAERFEVAGLDPQVGQTLTLVVVADDANDLTGPGVGRGPERSFRIVTPEELLAQLFDREVNLRRIFERSLEEVTAVGDDLALISPQTDEADVRRTAGLAASELGQNAGQAEAVQSGFREILAELLNNGVQTSNAVARLEELILQPLTEIADVHFLEADRAVGALRVAAESGAPPTERAALARTAAEATDRLAAAMAAVLREMEELAEYHELVRDFQQLVDRQGDLLDRTRQEQKTDLIDGLFE